MTDPTEILGVGPNAGEEELRAAYLQKVKQFPPDRSPEEFEKIRDAFEVLNDPRKRMQLLIESAKPPANMASLMDGMRPRREFTGPQIWRDVLKTK
jgi:curved DNA-binding protein CbpA